MNRAGAASDWPTETLLLGRLRHDGWALYRTGNSLELPRLIAAVAKQSLFANVVIIQGHDRVAGYCTTEIAQPLAAQTVTWHYLGGFTQVITALPTDRETLATPYPIPGECRVSHEEWRSYTMRPPR